MALWHQQAAVGCSRCDAPLEPLAVGPAEAEAALSGSLHPLLEPLDAEDALLLEAEDSPEAEDALLEPLAVHSLTLEFERGGRGLG
jgi:hypothetical protein